MFARVVGAQPSGRSTWIVPSSLTVGSACADVDVARSVEASRSGR
jgi:hypothetical protein